jgi:hypothetical protein
MPVVGDMPVCGFELVVAMVQSKEDVVVLTAQKSDGEGEDYHVFPVRPTLAADRAITSKVAKAQKASGRCCCYCSGE